MRTELYGLGGDGAVNLLVVDGYEVDGLFARARRSATVEARRNSASVLTATTPDVPSRPGISGSEAMSALRQLGPFKPDRGVVLSLARDTDDPI